MTLLVVDDSSTAPSMRGIKGAVSQKWPLSKVDSIRDNFPVYPKFYANFWGSSKCLEKMMLYVLYIKKMGSPLSCKRMKILQFCKKWSKGSFKSL